MSKPADVQTVRKVAALLLSGMGQEDVRAVAVAAPPLGLGLALGEVGPALKAARAKITAAGQIDAAAFRAERIARMKDLYAKCVAEKDIGAALRVDRELAKVVSENRWRRL